MIERDYNGTGLAAAGENLTNAVATAQPTDEECAAFQALMSERIGAGENLQSYPHMHSCERCRSLIDELEYIAKAIHDLFPPDVEPATDLWPGIATKLERKES